jgi:quercetin dioxygenase-like cupin family protein
MDRPRGKAAFLTAAASLGLLVSVAKVTAESNPIVKLPGEVSYGEAAAGMPQVAVLYGDPDKPGFYVVRLKFPSGTKIPPHTHPEGTRTLTVVSGTLYFGFGEAFEETKVTAFPPGTFFTELPTSPHFVWAKDGEVVVQVAGFGPSGFLPSH